MGLLLYDNSCIFQLCIDGLFSQGDLCSVRISFLILSNSTCDQLTIYQCYSKNHNLPYDSSTFSFDFQPETLSAKYDLDDRDGLKRGRESSLWQGILTSPAIVVYQPGRVCFFFVLRLCIRYGCGSHSE